MRDSTVRRAARAVERLAERARQDPVAFLEFAARSEHERERVVPAAHQRVLLDFVASHRRSVVRAFVGSGKTWTLAYLGIHLSGNNPTGRGAVIGASGSAAAQTLGLIRDVVEDARGEYPEVRVVFPKLRPSPNVSDPWGQRAITFDRPGGIRDPSWIAIGYGGALPGKRLRWIVGDDMLDEVNTATAEARNKFGQTYARKVLTRLDAREAMNVFLNTPWDPDDATFRLEEAGWPTLSMEVEGEVRVANTEWTSPELRPSRLVPGAWRLAANDGPEWAPLCDVLPDGSRRRADLERPSGLPTEHFDLDEEVPLWPGTRDRPKFDREAIAAIREDFRADPGAFMAKYKLRPRVPADEQKKRAWVEECKANARALGVRGCATSYRGPNLTTTGLDLATGAEDGSDWRALFTYETVPELRFQLPDGRWRHLHNARRILSVRYGRWVGEELVKVVEAEVEAFDSTLRVETNGCFAKGSLVLTIDGYRPIEEIKAGDLVWTHAGRWRPVLENYIEQTRLVCTARARGCVPVKTTPTHWFLMKRCGRTPGRRGGHHRPVGEAEWISIAFDRRSWLAVAKPKWPESKAVLNLWGKGLPRYSVDVDEEIALFLGLYMAEGHSTRGQVFFSIARKEEHLARLVERVARRIAPRASVRRRVEGSTMRVVICSTSLASVLKTFGVNDKKSPPRDWFGWPVNLRVAMVRGWLLGDGSLQTNNARSKYAANHFEAFSVSRNWALFARATLFEIGLRPMLSKTKERSRTIRGKSVVSKAGYRLTLNHADSRSLRERMKDDAEVVHWKPMVGSLRKAPFSGLILDDSPNAWSLQDLPSPGVFETVPYVDVHNLVVEEDHSFVVEDHVVHNGADHLRQWLVARQKLVSITAHVTTAANKNARVSGIPGLFIVLENLAWIIPCDEEGRCPEDVQRWVDGLLAWRPELHPDDGVIASWLAHEQARSLLGDGFLGVDLATVEARFR